MLKSLADQLAECSSIKEKIEVLSNFSPVKNFLEDDKIIQAILSSMQFLNPPLTNAKNWNINRFNMNILPALAINITEVNAKRLTTFPKPYGCRVSGLCLVGTR